VKYGSVVIMVQYNEVVASPPDDGAKRRHRWWRLLLDGLVAYVAMAGGVGSPLPYLLCGSGGEIPREPNSESCERGVY
jgi:hypothetical protein